MKCHLIASQVPAGTMGSVVPRKDSTWTGCVGESLGVGFNRAHDFTNTPLIFEALPKTALTYTLGAGVQKVLNGHGQIGLGYELAYWEESELGRALEQTMNTGLTLSHLRGIRTKNHANKY